MSSILYLLQRGELSKLHRLPKNEIWNFYSGSPLNLETISPEGMYRTTVLDGSNPMFVVLANCWQTATTLGEYTLCGCTVAPPFEYSDLEFGDSTSLLSQFPNLAGLIQRTAAR